MVLARLTERLDRPVDIASMAFFRIAFGAVMTIATIRFFEHGWIALDYTAPKHFFHYWGFGWVRPWPGVGMYVHYGIMAVAGACIALGVAHRAACIVFCATFTYAHFCDKSNYLNHYYLVSLLSFLLIFLPVDRYWSLRTLFRPGDTCPRAHAWTLWLLRFQVAVVYVFAGLAKVQADWLFHGEPLRIWLSANSELPLLGRLVQRPWVPSAFSWCGMLFDVSVVPLLLWRRTRVWAFSVLLVFHGLTSVLFRIGIFPWLMTLAAMIFFDPGWPRRFAARFARKREEHPLVAAVALDRKRALMLGAYVAVQLLLPIRRAFYPGNTLWSEEGFRFSWNVMLIEKSGELELTVEGDDDRRTIVDPRQYLTAFQARMVATQPDMILELAHVVAEEYERRGEHVRVYANAQVSFNGRRRAPLVDPTVDLAHETDGLGPKKWILPAPTDRPEF